MNYDRVILELIDRVSALEDEMTRLKQSKHFENEKVSLKEMPRSNETVYMEPRRRDNTKYAFNNQIYAKNRLVLAVVRAYFKDNPDITANELSLTFDRRIQGSLGVVRTIDELKRSYPDFQRRFFAYSDEVIHTKTGDCVVCSQWGSFNIDNFIQRARQLGFEIQSV